MSGDGPHFCVKVSTRCVENHTKLTLKCTHCGCTTKSTDLNHIKRPQLCWSLLFGRRLLIAFPRTRRQGSISNTAIATESSAASIAERRSSFPMCYLFFGAAWTALGSNDASDTLYSSARRFGRLLHRYRCHYKYRSVPDV